MKNSHPSPPRVQPRLGNIFKNSQNFPKAKLEFAKNYLHSIYVVLGIINNLEMI